MPRRAPVVKRRHWTSAEDDALRQSYADVPSAELARKLGRRLGSVYQRAYALGLHKSAEYLASPAAARTNGRQGIGTRFPVGHVPANKGLRRPGWGPGRMKATQFQKGGLSGRAQQLLKPVGTERLSKEGYLERKVHSDIPAGATRKEANRLRMRRWRAVHIILWESVNGPVPKGHALAFKNRDKTDIRLDNLECLTRSELMKRNSVHNLPAPLPQTIQLLGALNRQIRRRQRAEEQDRRPA